MTIVERAASPVRRSTLSSSHILSHLRTSPMRTPLQNAILLGSIVFVVIIVVLCVAAFLRERRRVRSLEGAIGAELEKAYRLQLQLAFAEEQRERDRARARLQSTFFLN